MKEEECCYLRVRDVDERNGVQDGELLCFPDASLQNPREARTYVHGDYVDVSKRH